MAVKDYSPEWLTDAEKENDPSIWNTVAYTMHKVRPLSYLLGWISLV